MIGGVKRQIFNPNSSKIYSFINGVILICINPVRENIRIANHCRYNDAFGFFPMLNTAEALIHATYLSA